ncbi:ATP-dependent protease subunit HslV [Bacillus velezensis]|nr:ATP-dependent protease subunit HslV [Bacillus velezensis]WEV83400.1 ATP-dependent protease subunit HslV [Bacillus velezensis]
MSSFHATTIFAVRHNGKSAMSGDGQVTFGQAVVMKHTARKVRKLFNGKVLAGFAGSVADAFTLFEMFEAKLEEYNGNLKRASVELAKEWRAIKSRKLEAMLIVMNQDTLLLVSGTGEVIEPDDGILAIGSGGNYALSAGRALKTYAGENLSAKDIAKAALKIAGEICVYTNDQIILEELE